MKTRFTPGKASIALAIVTFVLSLVPFSGITGPSQAKSQPVRTEWVARDRVVTRRVTHYTYQEANAPATNRSPYSLQSVQHHTRLITLTIARCARRHAPPAWQRSQKVIPSSGHEDPSFPPLS